MLIMRDAQADKRLVNVTNKKPLGGNLEVKLKQVVLGGSEF